MLRGGIHRLSGALQTLDKSPDTLVIERSARACALCERLRLLSESRLQLGKHARAVAQLLAAARVAIVIALQIPGRQQDLPLALRNGALLVAHAPGAGRAALRLPESAFERLHLHHEQVRLHGAPTIARHGVVGNQVARREASGALELRANLL